MDDLETYRQKAIKIAAKVLLDRWDVVKENDNLIDALEQSIGLGGGQSFIEEIGPYWAFEYKPGIKIFLWQNNEDCERLSYGYIKEFGFPDDYRPIIYNQISRSEFIIYAREIWNQKKHGQMKLF